MVKVSALYILVNQQREGYIMEPFQIFVNAESANPTFEDWSLYVEEAVQYYLEQAGQVSPDSAVTVVVRGDAENPDLPDGANVHVDELEYRAVIVDWSTDPETGFPACLMLVEELT